MYLMDSNENATILNTTLLSGLMKTKLILKTSAGLPRIVSA